MEVYCTFCRQIGCLLLKKAVGASPALEALGISVTTMETMIWSSGNSLYSHIKDLFNFGCETCPVSGTHMNIAAGSPWNGHIELS